MKILPVVFSALALVVSVAALLYGRREANAVRDQLAHSKRQAEAADVQARAAVDTLEVSKRQANRSDAPKFSIDIDEKWARIKIENLGHIEYSAVDISFRPGEFGTFPLRWHDWNGEVRRIGAMDTGDVAYLDIEVCNADVSEARFRVKCEGTDGRIWHTDLVAKLNAREGRELQ